MATSKGQRVGIWIIVVFLVIGTLGGFAAIILQPINQEADMRAQQKAYEEQLEELRKQQEESRKASKPLKGYESKLKPFDKDKVKELKVEVLKKGKGKKLKADSVILANYFGWTADGKIFDSTNKNGETNPIEFSLTGVIKGWTEGLTGVTVGSTVLLTIPSDMAYGDISDGFSPTGPLKFVVEVKKLVE